MITGLMLIGLGIVFQTDPAQEVAKFPIKAMGYVLIGVGALVALVSVAALVGGRRQRPPLE